MRSRIDMLKINSNSPALYGLPPVGSIADFVELIQGKKPLPGCCVEDASKPKTRLMAGSRPAKTWYNAKIEYCFDCGDFPCARLVHLDKRYRAKYGTSVMDNLLNIKKIGIKKFIENEIRNGPAPLRRDALYA